ncbi:MAG: hypothetical protein SGI98_09650, partial [Verrucomicrobiota bacterium]|nr:hypothetical protein [Verrucomicrobiota bacterium]
ATGATGFGNADGAGTAADTTGAGAGAATGTRGFGSADGAGTAAEATGAGAGMGATAVFTGSEPAFATG